MARSLFAWPLLLAVLLGTVPDPAAGQARSGEPTTELIVRLSDDAPASLRQALTAPATRRPAAVAPLFNQVEATRPAFPLLQSHNANTEHTDPASWPVYLVSVTDESALASVQAAWSRQPGVRYVEPNDFFALNVRARNEQLPRDLPISLDPDTINEQLDHLDVIRAREAHRITRGDPSVTIGVIDSGVFYTHPDLTNQVWVNRPEDTANAGTFVPANRQGTDNDNNGWADDVIGYSFVDRPVAPQPGRYGPRDPNPRPDSLGAFSGHGTAVAGVFGAQYDNGSGMEGVAPGARVALLRAFGGDGLGRTRDIAAAILYGAEMGMDVLNMSFGRDRASPLLREVIQFANAQGTVTVASAGNTSGDAPHYPSDYPEVLSTIWLAEDGNGLPAFSVSSYGIGADLGAPGTDVFTTSYPRTVPPNEITPADLYGEASGSSFAAPQVTGAVALLRSLDPSLSPGDIRSILTSTTVDVGIPGWDNRTAAGRLDVYEALKRALPGDTQIATPAHNSGWDADRIVITGSSLHPKHASYQLSYTSGTQDIDGATWTPIHEAVAQRVLDDTLATWRVAELEEGAYTLRLVTRLTDGRTVEDRRRVLIQRTAPVVTVHAAESGLAGGNFGVLTDIATSQRTRVALRLVRASDTTVVESEFRRRRHGVTWPDASGAGGPVALRITAINDAGLSTHVDTTVTLPERRFRSGLLARHETTVPRGFLLPQLTDFDGDALPELLLNPLNRQGGLGDSLRLYEWTGSDFALGDSLRANVIPRDVRNTDDDAAPELLTQVVAATLLLKQGPGEWLPKTEAFIDTTRSPDTPFIGSRLVDLQQLGTAQILGHTRSVWQGRSYNGTSYVPAFELDPRDVFAIEDTLDLGSIIGSNRVAVGDYTGNGRENLVVGERYGHFVMYETPPGATTPEPIWSHASGRFLAGKRFASGDVTGDGVDNFVTYTQHYPLDLPDGSRMPPRSTYTVWGPERNGEEDGFVPVYRLPVAGPPGQEGSITTANLTGDDRKEVVIAHSPYLIVLRNDPSAGWHVAYLDDRDGIASTLSPAMAAGDVTGNGRDDVFVSTRGPHLVRYSTQDNALVVAPPQWRAARPRDAETVVLEWTASRADSVGVYRRVGEAPFSLVAVETDAQRRTLSTRESATYALRAWRDGTASPLSPPRRVVPHPPATVVDVSYPASNQVRLRFDTALSEDTRANQFTYEGATARRVVGVANYEAIVVTLPPDVPQLGTLRWRNVMDALALPVGQTTQDLTLPGRARAPFFLTTWDRASTQQVVLQFNRAVDAVRAAETAEYRITPPATVEAARIADTDSTQVVLTVGGAAIGASGRTVTLYLDHLISADGRALAQESRAVQLTGPANDLDGVYVYPNPMRATDHAPRVTVAGLPTEATIRVVSVDGRLVRTLRTRNAVEGGVEWDLKDASGQRVPTGVYYLRVESPGEEAVMKKAAVIW